MKYRISILLLVVVSLLGLSGCSQFSTQPPEIPRTINITDEQFEKQYVLRTRGIPTTIELDYRASDYYIEVWDYPGQHVMVMFVVTGDRYKVKTCHYRGMK